MSKHKIGDYVWAKAKGFHAWPARISEPKPDSKPMSDKKVKVYVYFYGSDTYAWVLSDQIWPYKKFKAEFFINEPGILEAVDELEADAAANPQEEEETDPAEEEKTPDENSDASKSVDDPAVSKAQQAEAQNTSRAKRKSVTVIASSAKKQKKVIAAKAVAKKLMKTNEKKKAKKDINTESLLPLRLPDILCTSPSALNLSDSQTLKIGFLGLGTMGSSIVSALLQAGHIVTVWNRTPSKCRDFVSQGAFKGISPADVVQSCDITFSCVSDSVALKELVSGDSGVLAAIQPGKAFVDMSSVDVDTVIELFESVTARGGRFLEAPLLGTLQRSESEHKPTSVVLAAGDSSLYEDCLPCFGTFAKKTFYLGEVGSATSLKLVLNAFYGTSLAGLAETLNLGEKVGLQKELILEILCMLPVASDLVASKGDAMVKECFNPPQLSLEHMQRGIRMAVAIAESVQQPVVVASATNELFKKAKARAFDAHDTSAIYRATD